MQNCTGMTYDESVAYLSSLAPRGWRLGLDRMAEFARRAGLADNLGDGVTQYLHVAGTNGKGSVTAYLQSALVEAGFRTGAFFSPYVVDLRERVQFGRALIPRRDFARIVTELKPIVDSFSENDFGGVTEFELKTAVGFRYWTEKRCEWVALEVGLGGRLDSTNIVDPACSVIVSIGLDHVGILGDTHAKIAAEKAGIVKPGKPVVVGDLPDSAMDVVVAVSRQREAPLWRLGREVRLERRDGWTVRTPLGEIDGLKPGIPGARQTENMALAVAALHAAKTPVDEDALRRGMAKASVPGRFEQSTLEDGTPVILDGAHNAEAAEALRESLEEAMPGRRFALVAGMVFGHDPSKFFAPLADVVWHGYAAPIGFHRAIPPIELAETVRGIVDLEPCGSLAEALRKARATGLPILVTGSFYLVGEASRRLKRRL